MRAPQGEVGPLCVSVVVRLRRAEDAGIASASINTSGRHVASWEEARAEANVIWLDIRAGRFRGPQAHPPAAGRGPLSFRAFADLWQARKGDLMVSGKIHQYRLGTICRFVRPGTTPPVTIGETALDALTLPDFEAFAEPARRPESRRSRSITT